MAEEVVGSAYVIIRAITDRVRNDIKDGIDKGMADARKDASKQGEDLGGTIGDKAGTTAGDHMAEGIDKSTTKNKTTYSKVGDSIGDSIGTSAGKTAGDKMAEAIDRQMSRNREKYRSVGVDIGNETGRGFSLSSIGSSITDTIKKVFSGGGGGGGGTNRSAFDAGKEAGRRFGAGLKSVPLTPYMIAYLAPALAGALKLVGAYVNAAISIVGQLGPALAGAAVSYVSAYLAIYQAIGAVTLAFKVQSPLLDRFKKKLEGLKPAFESIGKAVQKTLLPDLGDAIVDIANNMIPILRKRLAETGAVVAGVAKRFANLTGQSIFKKNFSTLLDNNNQLIGHLGNGIVNLADAFVTVFAEAKPVINLFGNWFERLTASAKATLRAKQRTGELAEFFQKARKSMSQWGDIIGNVSVALFNTFAAAAPAGRVFVKQLDRITTKWREFTESTKGKNQMKEFFQNSVPIVKAFNKLIYAVGEAFIKMMADPEMGKNVVSVIDTLRVDLLPALIEMTQQLGKAAPGFIELAAAVARMIGAMAESGAIGHMSDVLSVIAKAIAGLLQLPVIGHVVGWTIAFAGVAKVVGGVIGLLWKFLAPVRGIIGFVLKLLRPLGVLVTMMGGWGAVIRTVIAAINPWVGAIALLVIGLVILYKKNEAFRNTVNAVWNGVKKIFTGAWVVIRNVLNAIGDFLTKELFPIFRRLWHEIIQPVFKGIGTVIRDVWASIVRPVFNEMKKTMKVSLVPVLRLVGKVVNWLWDHVIKPVFKFIGKTIRATWEHGIKPALNAWISFYSKILFPIIRFLYEHVVKPIFKLIGKAIVFAIRSIRATMMAWKTFLEKILFPVIRFLWKNVVVPVFNGIKKAISVAWNNGIKPVWNAIRGFIVNILIPAFNKVKGAVSTVFEKIGNVIESIWNNVIKPPLDAFKNILGDIKDAVEWVLDNAGKIKDALPDLPSAGDIGGGIKGALGFAAGGYVTQPTRAIVGEGKEAEAILPRSVLQGLMEAAARVGSAAAGGRGGGGGGGKATVKAGKNPKFGIDFDDKGLKRANKAFTGTKNVISNTWKKGIKPDLQAWIKTTNNDLAPTIQRLESKTVRNTMSKTSKDFTNFRSGPLKNFSGDWGNQFKSKLPNDANTFSSKVRDAMGRTKDGISNTWSGGIKPVLQSFGQFPKQSVQPAFAKGVDAIGATWSKVENKTKSPVKFVIETVLNAGLIAAFNKIAKFVDADTIENISLPRGFKSGGFTGNMGKNAVAGFVHGKEWVIPAEATASIRANQPGFLDRLNRDGAKALPGHKSGGFVNPDKRVYIDGEPLAAVAAAQIGLAAKLSRSPISVMQGGWQPPSDYSGTSHQYPGVADTSPGSFAMQGWLRKVGMHGWARNIAGAASAGSGAHVHSLSIFSPGTASSPQFVPGGDGLGGSDYGPNPPLLPGLQDMLKRFGPLPSSFAGGAPMLPSWAQKIMNDTKKWAMSLLDGGDELSSKFGDLVQKQLNVLAQPISGWASDQLGKFSSAIGIPGGAMPGPKQLDKAGPDLAKRYAYGRLKAFGFGKSQWDPLANLWNRESGWRWNADNPSSTAYGIPQSLPGSKMASAGANWLTNAGTQINWGLGYIKSTYGNPAKAWAHSENVGWYDNGGLLKPGQIAANMSRHVEPVFSHAQWMIMKRFANVALAEGATIINIQKTARTLDRIAKSLERLAPREINPGGGGNGRRRGDGPLIGEINVHNPIRERGSDSFQRQMVRISTLGLLDSKEW